MMRLLSLALALAIFHGAPAAAWEKHKSPTPSVAPSIDGIGYSRLPLTANNPTTISLNSDSGLTRLLTTSHTNDVVIVTTTTGTSARSAGPAIASIASTSGLSFIRLQGSTQTLAGHGFAEEMWAAPAATPLANENITVTFTDTIGSGVIGVVAVSGANAVYQDLGVTPPAVDAEIAPSFPNVTITTTNAHDFLLWFSGGTGAITNTAPSGFSIPFAALVSTTFFTSTTVSMYQGYLRVSTVQVGVNFAPASNIGTGMAILAAIKN